MPLIQCLRYNSTEVQNIDAHAALRLHGEIAEAQQVKHWLDYTNLNWKEGPLDIHSWRVLSLGADYGFSLNHDYLFQYTLDNGVTGFVADKDRQKNIWTEGTGGMAVAFYMAGYPVLGNFYTNQLEKLIINSQSNPGIKTNGLCT